jgi:hypothetical protein
LRVGVQGSRSFSDYQIFLRAMRTILSEMGEDKQLTIYSAGPHKVNQMIIEFLNITEKSIRSLGISARLVRLSPKTLKSEMGEMDNFVYLCKPKETLSELVKEAEDKDIFVGVYRYE